MKVKFFSACSLAAVVAISAFAQPSYEAAPPSRSPVKDANLRLQQYHARVDEVIQWRAATGVKPGELIGDMSTIGAKLVLRQDIDLVNRSVITLMKDPSGSGPFWMFPVVSVAYLGQDQLSAEAKQSIRDALRTGIQIRGDTENHWAMYYTSLYLLAQLYPNEPGTTWYNGKSSEENLQDARAYLLQWMDWTTTVGQGEFNCTHYIGEYAIPMLQLATWAKDPAMRQRGKMMLDWIFADYISNSLNGVLRGANARTDDNSLIERWNSLSTFFNWLLVGNVPPTASYGSWGNYFALIAKNYELPEVIYLIGVDRGGDTLQTALKRSRRRWRFSDVWAMPVYKTDYLRQDYAVGSFQGGLADPIQSHVWDVTWDVADPRGAHNTMFSMHPISSGQDMQTYFTELPDQMIKGVAKEGKPSYDQPDKLLGSSRFEQVFQDLDTVVALYNIPEGTRFPHINGFFSRHLKNLTVDKSGWIFAQGGNTYLAYRPLAAYTLEPLVKYKSMWTGERDTSVATDQRLLSPHLKNGTIVQAASASEFKSFDEFKAAINALPLEFKLEPVPTVKFKTLRGKTVVCTYGEIPKIDGKKVDYAKWKLFAGPYLNAEKDSRKLTITHGKLERVLDFNTVTVTDRVKE
ncbi:hypothetical protein [Oleiharenicola lentus]|uniref:hypothetical protein n=1 Tax=Oleiharenicola lentus TaxID=2508720 RepID=UPI003F66569F